MDLSSQLILNMQTGPKWGWTDSDLSLSLLILVQPASTLGQELASVSRRKRGPRSRAGSLVSSEPIPLAPFLPPKPWGILQSPTSLSLPADSDHLKRDGGSQPSSGISRVIQRQVLVQPTSETPGTQAACFSPHLWPLDMRCIWKHLKCPESCR